MPHSSRMLDLSSTLFVGRGFLEMLDLLNDVMTSRAYAN